MHTFIEFLWVLAYIVFILSVILMAIAGLIKYNVQKMQFFLIGANWKTLEDCIAAGNSATWCKIILPVFYQKKCLEVRFKDEVIRRDSSEKNGAEHYVVAISSDAKETIIRISGSDPEIFEIERRMEIAMFKSRFLHLYQFRFTSKRGRGRLNFDWLRGFAQPELAM